MGLKADVRYRPAFSLRMPGRIMRPGRCEGEFPSHQLLTYMKEVILVCGPVRRRE